MMGERKFGTMQRLTRGRNAGQPRQDPHSAPAMMGLFEEDATPAQGKAVIFSAKLQRRARPFSRKRGWIGCSAKSSHGARLTLWPRTADESAQFHERRVMSAGIVARQELRGGGPEQLASGARVDRHLQVEDAGENAGDVCFDDRDRSVEGERGDGVCRITANSGKLLNRSRVSRKSAAVFFEDGDGGRPEIAGARVVTEPLPGVKNVMFRGGGERGKIREPDEPFIIIREDGRDLGLLEHELGDENRVGIGGAAPGKIAAAFAIPGKEGAAKGWSGIRIHVIEENVERPTPNVQRRIQSLSFEIGRWAFGVRRLPLSEE